MGVLNVTPDSFSDGGLYFAPERAIQRGVELVRQGADWIDVGGESTRPGSQRISAEEELRRVLPVIRGLRRELRSVPISIDTTKAEVAEQALRAGANILNDVSGLRFEPRLAEVARRWDLAALDATVRESQRRRRLVDSALTRGAIRAWDFQPFRDASRQYMRNSMDLDDLEAMARFPRVGGG